MVNGISSQKVISLNVQEHNLEEFDKFFREPLEASQALDFKSYEKSDKFLFQVSEFSIYESFNRKEEDKNETKKGLKRYRMYRSLRKTITFTIFASLLVGLLLGTAT